MEQKERFEKDKLLKLLASPYLDEDLVIEIKNLIPNQKEASLQELFQILDKYIYERKVQDEDLRVAFIQEKDSFESQLTAKADEINEKLALFNAQISEEEKPERVREIHQKILS